MRKQLLWDPYAEFQNETLPNGLNMHVSHWPKRPWQYIGFVIHNGTQHDPIGLEGLSHFLEHMLSLNNDMTRRQIWDFFDNQGGWANLGGTSFMSTRYSFYIPINIKTIEKALSIYGQLILQTKIEKSVESERNVIIGEFHRNFPEKFRHELSNRKNKILHKGHWMERSVSPLGSLESINKIKSNNLQEYYDKYYVPNNISIVAIGGLEIKEIIKLISESSFSENKEGSRTQMQSSEFITFPLSENEHVFEIPKEILKTTGDYKSYAKIPLTFNRAKMNILKYMLSEILFEEIREKRSWAYHIGVDYHKIGDRYEHIIECQGLAPEGINSIGEVISDCIKNTQGSDKLFLKIKKQILNWSLMSDQSGQDIFDGSIEDLSDSQRIITLKEYCKSVESVKMNDINNLIDYLCPEKRWTLIMRP